MKIRLKFGGLRVIAYREVYIADYVTAFRIQTPQISNNNYFQILIQPHVQLGVRPQLLSTEHEQTQQTVVSSYRRC